MDSRRVTLTIAEFCARTGVGRERLRTWERRHGFPQPVRQGGGARRYDVDDVARVIAVHHALRSGVPLTAAIRAARASDPAETPAPGAEDFHAEVDHAPLPLLAVTGPDPVTVLWRNGFMRGCAGAPREGRPLLESAPSMSGTDAEHVLRGLLSGTVEGPVLVSHPDWCSEIPRRASSLAWCSAGHVGGPPVVILLGLPASSDPPRPAEDDAWLAAFCAASAAASATLREHVGPSAMLSAVESLASGVGAGDAVLATYAAGSLLGGRSIRGRIAPSVVAVCAFDDVSESLHDGTVDWLGAPACEAFGLPAEQHLVIVPVIAAGERLGVLLLAFAEQFALGDPERAMLLAAGTSLGFALLRQRVADQLAEHSV
jgi:MerR family transcriptional regulator, light-induced transcriptional regulator